MTLPLQRGEDWTGYFLDDIKESMDSFTFRRFVKWMRGHKTEALDGKVIIYAGDFKVFQRGEAA